MVFDMYFLDESKHWDQFTDLGLRCGCDFSCFFEGSFQIFQEKRTSWFRS